MSAGLTLFEKVWNAHVVRQLPTGQVQLFIGLHLVHEVTSPQAFTMLAERGLPVRFPDRTIATADHIVPTTSWSRPFADRDAEDMIRALDENCRKHGIRFWDEASGRQGIVHVLGPELGATQPGMTIACGDSHTATHGALGTLAFGIGSTQARDLLATQCLAMSPLKTRRIRVEGKLAGGVFSKDVILAILRRLGTKGGVGFAYEYAGSAIRDMTIEERLTVCNMSIEGGARCGYVGPDEHTFDYLRGRPLAPQGEAFDRAVAHWRSLATDEDARFDDEVEMDAARIAPSVTWGITPGQNIGVDECIPKLTDLPDDERGSAETALAYTKLRPGDAIQGTPIDVAFVGSCTNGRISDLRTAAQVAKTGRVHSGVRAIVVPGSMEVERMAIEEGLDEVFRSAGFEWRRPGCSMCLAMNPDKLVGSEMCASSSNRNFKGRQGSPTGRTLLMSPAMVVAAALEGKVADVRERL